MRTQKQLICLLSGGLDSTLALLWAAHLCNPSGILALSFDYAQRHKVELESAEKVAELVGVDHTLLSIGTIFEQLGPSALTTTYSKDDADELDPPSIDVPNTFVPGRNALFATIAAVYGWHRSIFTIVLGVSQLDTPGYPDCSSEAIRRLQAALIESLHAPFVIRAPWIRTSKAAALQWALRVLPPRHVLDVLSHTHTCYMGEVPPCGECDACVQRAAAFNELDLHDPLVLATAESEDNE